MYHLQFSLQAVSPETFGYLIFWSENPKGRGHSEDFGVDGKIII
jgi:hypothetical protein